MFAGTYFRSLDRHNRITIPKDFAPRQTPYYVVRPILDNMALEFADDMKGIFDLTFRSSIANDRQLSTVYKVDYKYPRIVLRKYLLKMASIERGSVVAIVGVGNTFNICSEDTYKRHYVNTPSVASAPRLPHDNNSAVENPSAIERTQPPRIRDVSDGPDKRDKQSANSNNVVVDNTSLVNARAFLIPIDPPTLRHEIGTTYQEKRQIFAQHPLLGKFGELETDTLLKYSRVECYPEGEEIFAKDSPSTCMMVVLRGSVRMSSISLAGREIVLNIINPGEIVGIEMIDGGPRLSDAIAMTDCELLVLNRRDFMPLLEKHGDICLMISKIMSERLRRTSEQVEDLVFRDVEQRIAKAILQLYHRFGRSDSDGQLRELHLSQSELANIIGITRESINKQLRVWQRAGFIDLAKELILIRDAAALERLI